MNYFLDAIKNKYADFSGRARRKEYWMYVLFYMIGMVACYIVDIILAATVGIMLLSPLYSLGLLVPTLAVAVRRLHDINKPWTMILVGLIPLAGGIWLLILMIQEGTRGDNQFGPDPKAGEQVL